MNSRLSQLMEYIPERSARALTGTAFSGAEAAACSHPDRLAHIMQFLDWLTPLRQLTKDDQRILGLRGFNGRPLHEGIAAEGEAEDLEASELDDADELDELHEIDELVVVQDSREPAAQEEQTAV